MCVCVCVCAAEGNPYNVASMYTAVASTDAGHVRIIRPELHLSRTNNTKLGNLLRTDDADKWLNSQYSTLS